jgi:hypothetical protein
LVGSGCSAWPGAGRYAEAVYMALIAATVVALKHYSPYSCPFDLLWTAWAVTLLLAALAALSEARV